MTLTIFSMSAGRLIAPNTRKPRRFFGRKVADREPVITSGELEGVPVLQVETFGRHGGASFMIDPDRWAAVSAERGTQWLLIPAADGWFYVGSSRIAASQRREHGGITPVAFLARILVGAKAGQHVRYRNGSALDLRMVNLELLGPRWPSSTWAILHNRSTTRSVQQ